jgi:uncharacterized protein (TIGR03437 family)
MSLLRAGIAGLLLLPALAWPQSAEEPMVKFKTNLGDIDVVLLPASAPKTVENFLRYLRRGAYENTIIHRLVSGFVAQGGGYALRNNDFPKIPSDPPVVNEYRLSNVRGTMAMAKLGNNPNSATNEWFFNLSDNSANLNNQNGGFTVFARVANDASLAVMDRIGSLPTVQFLTFDSLPLFNYRGGSIGASNIVVVSTIQEIIPVPSIAANGVVSAAGFGALPVAAPGSYIEIYGTNLSGFPSRGWANVDFRDSTAPTTLEGVSVTIGGKPAFVSFVSGGQVNVQVPADVAAGPQPVIVTHRGQTSAASSIEIKTTAPGLLAPPSFKVADKQYAAALHAANNTFVNGGNIAGIDTAPAAPGETLIFYGIGFGPIDNANVPVAGKIVSGEAKITTPVEFLFNDVPGRVAFAGLAPGLVGLYQFNVAIPSSLPDGDAKLTVKLGGETAAQTLYLAVKKP